MPVVVKAFSDIDGFEAAIIENVQRADLNPLEEAQGYQKLISEYGHTQEMVSAVTGKSRSHVGNLIRLLDLPDDVQSLVRMGVLTLGHAKVLLQVKDPAALARQIAAEGLNVRQAEAAARRSLSEARGGKPPIAQAKRDHELESLGAQLSDHLGLKVAIEARGRRGVVTLKFSDLDQLDHIVAKLQS
jgi:ParB family chromosome partitioning protein